MPLPIALTTCDEDYFSQSPPPQGRIEGAASSAQALQETSVSIDHVDCASPFSIEERRHAIRDMMTRNMTCRFSPAEIIRQRFSISSAVSYAVQLGLVVMTPSAAAIGMAQSSPEQLGDRFRVIDSLFGADSTTARTKAMQIALARSITDASEQALLQAQNSTIQTALQSIDADITYYITNATGSQFVTRRLTRLLTQRAEYLCMSRPVKSLSPKCNLQALSGLLGESNRASLDIAFALLRQNADARTPEPLCSRLQLFLYGAPGVGKTRLAKLMSENTGLPLRALNMDACKMFSDFEHIPVYRPYDDEPTNGVLHLGVLMDALVESDCPNPIILMDEADRFLNLPQNAGPLKRFFDTEGNRSVRGPQRTQIPFNRATLIVIGNSDIEDAALRERFIRVAIPDVPVAQKSACFMDFVDEHIRHFSCEPAQRTLLRERAENFRECIIALNEKHAIKGVRTIKQCAENLVKHLYPTVFHGQPYCTANAERVIAASFKSKTIDATPASATSTTTPQIHCANQDIPDPVSAAVMATSGALP